MTTVDAGLIKYAPLATQETWETTLKLSWPLRSAPTKPEAGTDGSHSAAQLAAGGYWDRVAAGPAALSRTAFWNDPPTLRHINRVVCGEPLDGQHAGFHRRLAALLAARSVPMPRALSVGSGTGGKEIGLLHSGIVGSFDCYEIGIGAVTIGRRLAAEQGVADRIHFHTIDAFSAELPDDFDLVYWNSSLHHMFDTAAAVAWSRDRLRRGGVFAADEYVGASRFQHSPELFAWSNRMLALLPDRLLRRPDPDAGLVPRVVGPIAVDELIQVDPSEAVDSANILPSVARTFRDVDIIPTGGALYFVALNDAFHNFTSPEDLRLLEALLLADEAVGRLGETQLAVIFAVKDG